MQWIDWKMVTENIGTVTGVAALIVSYVSYRKISTLKSLDLRLELRKAINHFDESVNNLWDVIDRAELSRTALAAAPGTYLSGMMEKWKTEVEADRKSLSQLKATAPKPAQHFAALKAPELESKLVELHKFQFRVDNFKEKYEAGLRSDDERREQIHEDRRALTEMRQRDWDKAP